MSAFASRHIGSDAAEQRQMLDYLQCSDVNQLVAETIPAPILNSQPIELAEPLGEHEALHELRELTASNKVLQSLYGQGYSPCRIPLPIKRNLLENPGWYTAYTPYQAEISQGRLEMLLNFQQVIQDLTAMEVSGASLLDDATASAEAMQMIARCNPAGVKAGKSFFVDAANHPQIIAVMRTRARYMGVELVVAARDTLSSEQHFGALLAYPDSCGQISDLRPAIEALHAHSALVAVSCELLALCLAVPPGELGADMVVGSAQRLGMPLGFGGPHAAFLACRSAHQRQLPGRLISVSKDKDGRVALRMALQTREQHIRRQKATSNICTAQALPAIVSAAYAIYHGPEGVRAIAEGVHARAQQLEQLLAARGYANANSQYFDCLCLSTGEHTRAIAQSLLDAGFLVRVHDQSHICLSVNELLAPADLERIAEQFPQLTPLPNTKPTIKIGAPRQSSYLQHPVFARYHSETKFMRYLKRLRDKDIALDRSMIALGSCTMKLNAACELEPILWSQLADIHPYAPKSHCLGYHKLFNDLSATLCKLTGFHAFSFQPNSGAQGEYSGLLAIRRYHEQRGEAQRDVCLIPSSAHGTNPASAVMAGLTVVAIASDAQGNIDLADVAAKIEQYGARLAAMMITYPSTHGVFESAIGAICAQVHAAGGQVYLDGANYNAQVALTKPADIGFDVMHINLHKTFCIPHGGGGPGMGPIGVREHLCPFLPQNPNNAACEHAVASAAYGSAMILPISWMYLRAMGAEGLRRATEAAILHANYLAARLQEHYPILYRGDQGRIAHECIIDIRGIKQSSGVTAEDVAKRLIDYGFHAPTLSFPVADTLMIEPTESEDLAELDRFCAAMIAIRQEIAAVEAGTWSRDSNPLRNAPHHPDMLLEDWQQPYSKQEAYHPLGNHDGKFWPPVSRVDNVYGDRNLFCSCPAWQ